eukprot:2006200-Rhodomonas_salina.2
MARMSMGGLDPHLRSALAREPSGFQASAPAQRVQADADACWRRATQNRGALARCPELASVCQPGPERPTRTVSAEHGPWPSLPVPWAATGLSCRRRVTASFRVRGVKFTKFSSRSVQIEAPQLGCSTWTIMISGSRARDSRPSHGGSRSCHGHGSSQAVGLPARPQAGVAPNRRGTTSANEPGEKVSRNPLCALHKPFQRQGEVQDSTTTQLGTSARQGLGRHGPCKASACVCAIPAGV